MCLELRLSLSVELLELNVSFNEFVVLTLKNLFGVNRQFRKIECHAEKNNEFY